MAAVAVAVMLAGPLAAAEAAGRGRPAAEIGVGWEAVWNWVWEALGVVAASDKGSFVDPNGAPTAAESDKGPAIDPNGVAVTAASDKGLAIDPNG